MSAVCGILRESFDEYLSDTLPAPQRRMLREHLAACETCRDAAASKDASLLFARPTTTEEVRPGEAAEILAAVRAGVAHIETERRIAGHPGRRRSAVAAAAAAVALLALTVPGGSSRRQAEIATAPVPTRVASEPAVAGLAPAALPAETEATPSNATIYDLNPGAGREEPRVVWIVDRGLDI